MTTSHLPTDNRLGENSPYNFEHIGHSPQRNNTPTSHYNQNSDSGNNSGFLTDVSLESPVPSRYSSQNPFVASSQSGNSSSGNYDALYEQYYPPLQSERFPYTPVGTNSGIRDVSDGYKCKTLSYDAFFFQASMLSSHTLPSGMRSRSAALSTNPTMPNRVTSPRDARRSLTVPYTQQHRSRGTNVKINAA